MFPLFPRRLFLLLLWVSLWIRPLSLHAQAQTPDPPWRQALTCDPAQQTFSGVEYCTSDAGKIHVLVIDTHSPGVHLEYVIAEGVNNTGVSGPCNDVNIPDWGPVRGGCADPNNPAYYPVMPLERAVALAQERHGQVAAVIDSDYGAGTQGQPGEFRGHGPEGLTVVRGVRLDGPANGDTDNNAVRRPWLAVSRDAPLRIELGQFDRDDGSRADWVYTGVGSAPWLIREGVIQKNAIESCENAPGSCYFGAAQTAVGLSQDPRWLFLVVDERKGALIDLARFLQDELAVWDAIKFDGGGSSQLWYNGQVIEPGDGRQLSQYLAVLATPGPGIEIIEPSPAPEPGNFLERLWGTVEQETQKAWETIRSRSERFLTEQWERLQREVDRQLAEWQQSLEQWLAEQQQQWEQEMQRQAEEIAWQLCGGNWVAGAVGAIAVFGFRRRRKAKSLHNH